MTMRSRATAFAVALDRDDFALAATFVHPDCAYESPGGTMTGRDAIIDRYRKNAAWARSTFDRIEFESTVEPMPDRRFRITYTDRTWHRPRLPNGDNVAQGSPTSKPLAHVYQCRQILTFDSDGLIRHIEHEEIPGQREALEAYFKACGVTRS